MATNYTFLEFLLLLQFSHLCAERGGVSVPLPSPGSLTTLPPTSRPPSLSTPSPSSSPFPFCEQVTDSVLVSPTCVPLALSFIVFFAPAGACFSAIEELFAFCFSRLLTFGRFSKLEVFGCFSKLEVADLTGGQGGRIPDFGGGIEEVEPDEGAREGPRAEELEMFVCFRLTPELDLGMGKLVNIKMSVHGLVHLEYAWGG